MASFKKTLGGPDDLIGKQAISRRADFFHGVYFFSLLTFFFVISRKAAAKRQSSDSVIV